MKVQEASFDLDEAVTQIDLARQASREAFVRRDIRDYMKVYASDLEYVQTDGETLRRVQFERGVDKQLRDLNSVDSMTFDVEERHVEGKEVVELVRTCTQATIIALLVVVRTMKVERLQRIRWIQTRGGWKVKRVDVLEEQTTINDK